MNEDNVCMLIVKPSMTVEFPPVSCIISECMVAVANARGFESPEIYLMYKQEPYDLLLKMMDAIKDRHQSTLTTTPNGSYWCIGPMGKQLAHTLRDILKDGLEDAGLLPMKRRTK